MHRDTLVINFKLEYVPEGRYYSNFLNSYILG